MSQTLPFEIRRSGGGRAIVGMHGPRHGVRARLLATAAPPAFTPTGIVGVGDSRVQLAGGLSAGVQFVSNTNEGPGFLGALGKVVGNVVKLPVGFNYGVTGSSTRAMHFRKDSLSTASIGSPADPNRNPAYDDTLILADLSWNVVGAGDATLTLRPDNVVMFMGISNGVGDQSYYTTDAGAHHNPLVCMQEAASLFDALNAAGKFVIAGETPYGLGSYWLEKHTISGAACTVTNGSQPGFVDGTDVGASGVIGVAVDPPTHAADTFIMVKVTGTPAAPNEYAVDNVGHYTFYTVTPPAAGYFTYSSRGLPIQVVNQSTQHRQSLRLCNDWLASTSATFTFTNPYTGLSHSIAGAGYNRPLYAYMDSYGATDGGGDVYGALKSLDGLHPSYYGDHCIMGAFLAAWTSKNLSLGLTSQAHPPTGINMQVASGNAVTIHLGSFNNNARGVLIAPSVMAFCNTGATASRLRFTYGGLTSTPPVVFTVTDIDGVKGRITGPNIDTAANATSNFVTYATGAWDMTFTAGNPPPNATFIYAETDWTNTLPNANFNLDHGTDGAKSTEITGSICRSWQVTADTSTRAAITAGALSVAVSYATDPDGSGRNNMIIDVIGTAPSGATGITIVPLNPPPLRMNPTSDKMISGIDRRIEKHPTNNGLYGLYAVYTSTGIATTALYRTPSFPAVTLVGDNNHIGLVSRPMTEMDVVGGPIDDQIVSASVDCTGVTGTTIAYKTLLSFGPGPVAFRVRLSQEYVRFDPGF
jgi:hypothetical protein